MGRLLSLLRRNVDFRRLYLAVLASLLGDWFAFVAVSGLLIEQTGNDAMPALVYAASVLPVCLATPLSGVLADRVDRRLLLVVSDLLRVPVALLLCVAAWWQSPVLALSAVLALSLLSTFFDPVASAALPNLVDEDDLITAQAAVGAAWGAMLVLGASLGGVVALTLGRNVAFLINAASFAVSAVLVIRIRRPLQTALTLASSGSWRTAWGEAASFLRARPVMRALIGSKAGVGIANGVVGVLPILAVSQFGATDVGIGLLLASRGAGVIVGPLLAARLRRWRPGRPMLVLLCGCAIVLYGLAYAAVPLAPSLAVAAVLVGVAHIGGGGQWYLSTLGLQAGTPDELRGRVLSIDYAIATLTIGISAIGAAVLTSMVSPATTILLQAMLAVGIGTSWLVLLRRTWRANSPDSHEN